MELKEFNSTNTATRVKHPAIGMNTTSGVFSFNEAACELLSLSPGCAVVLHQDQKEKENWYVEKLSTKEVERGFVLRGKDAKVGLSFNSTTLARQIFESVNISSSSGKMLLAGQFTSLEKRKLFGILTCSFKETSRQKTDADH
ncbi:hypothetical protein [Chitinophaga sp. YIM B06452]|uniref:hypothetical protein n=1 Tax=Chitinophaga sp. YIM B06452 TaxID=3082158 RepID=UPI0031FF26F8